MAKALREGLEADEYSVRVAHTGEEGFYLIQAQPFDLVILDVMLPGHDGFEILSTLRKRMENDPVTEARVAAGEHRKIARMRLEALLRP